MTGRWLPGVPGPQIEEIFKAGIATGRFDSPESSDALASNAFGFFLNRPGDLPPLPGCERESWPAVSLALEERLHFPWRGGGNPVLDVLISTRSALIGIESKRFEPFRRKLHLPFSDMYWREVWGNRMKGYEMVREKLNENTKTHVGLGAAQFVKHALALRTRTSQGKEYAGLKPILFYIYAEPQFWPKNDKPVAEESKAAHREEIASFAKDVEDDEVRFVACTYREMLEDWQQRGAPDIREHAENVMRCFTP